MRRNFKKDKYPQSSKFPWGKQSILSKSNTLTWFECGAIDYFIRNCPKKKKEAKWEDRRDD